MIDRDASRIEEKVTGVASVDERLKNWIKELSDLRVNINKARENIENSFKNYN